MEKYIAIFYTTSAGDTKKVAQLLQKELGEERTDLFDIFHIRESEYTIFKQYDFLIFGSATYTGGIFHFRWKRVFSYLKKFDFSEKYVALFALGNQKDYPKDFALALDGMYQNLISYRDIAIIGECNTKKYKYNLKTKSVKGLIIDQRNEKNLTKERIKFWVESIREYADD